MRVAEGVGKPGRTENGNEEGSRKGRDEQLE